MHTSVPWEVLYGVGALVLVLALAWGTMQSRKRNRANDRVTEAATRESYEHPEAYKQEKKEFEKHVKPS